MVLTLACYSLLILLASLLGGWAPLIIRLTHTRMQFAVSFVSGMMLGVAFFHMLPHAVETLGEPAKTMPWVVAGFLLTFFLQRFFYVHHHVAPPEEGEDLHQHACGEPSHEPDDLVAERFSWGGAALGLTIHSFIAGVALAAAVESEWVPDRLQLAGMATFFAILFHKPFDSLTIVTLMAAGGWSKRSCHAVNFLFSLAIPLGVTFFYFGARFFGAQGQHTLMLGGALGLSAGVFLCISASDLLPEMQFHKHDRLKLSIALLCGLLLAYAIETTAHSHDHNHSEPGHKHSQNDHGDSHSGHDHHNHGSD